MTIRSRVVGRPRAFDTGEVLDAALELFWRNGYRATTTRDLEARLGLKQSSIYNAFGAKQNILDAALDRYERRIDRDLVQPLEASQEGLEAIDVFFKTLGHWVTHEGNRGCMLVNIMAEDGGATDAIIERTRRYRLRLRNAFCCALERATALEETTGDVRVRADLLLGLVLGVNIAARGCARPAELRRLIAGVRAQVANWRN